MKCKNYGNAGVLILPWQGFAVPLYDGNAVKDSQTLVDNENSAVIKRKWRGGHCDYIADHAAQGFDIIRHCTYVNLQAVIQTPTRTQIYNWVATMLGKNTGNLTTCTGQNLEKIKWADLCLYTCNDIEGKNITMVFFKLQEEIDRAVFNIIEDQILNNSNKENLSNEIKYVQATATVNFRKGPSTSYRIIDTLSKGTKTIYLGETSNGEWFNVTYKDIVGWISSKYSKLVN